MPVGRLVDATAEHAAAIAADARPADVAELWSQARATPLSAMKRGIATSVFAFTGLVDDVPVCMFGVVPGSALGGIGSPWMVGARALEQHQRMFLRACRPAVEEMNRMFPRLINAVDARNTLALRWLKWLGFTIYPAQPMGFDQLPFHPFEKRRHV